MLTGMSFMSKYKKNEPISVIILATLPDHGIKSLGNKSLFRIKNKFLIDYQISFIKKILRGIKHEILLLSSFETNKLQKNIKNNSVKIIDQSDIINLNFGGSLIEALEHIKYDNIIFLNYGLFIRKYDRNIRKVITENHDGVIFTSKKSTSNNNLNIGCLLDKEKIQHIFFDIGEYKYLDFCFLNSSAVKHIRQTMNKNFYRNKFTFEIMNNLLEKFKIIKLDIDNKTVVFIDSVKKFNKTKRLISNDNANQKTASK